MSQPKSILVVRLSSMGDIVHTVPAFAALRKTFPAARIDWLVEQRFRGVVDMVDGVNNVIAIDPWSVLQMVRQVRFRKYDITIDFQGLIKSALLARAAGSERVLGFSMEHAREGLATRFYKESIDPEEYGHVVLKNLSLIRSLVPPPTTLDFPLRIPGLASAPKADGESRYVVLVPGASWSHKQWPPESFGRLASKIKEEFELGSLVTQGNPQESRLAERVVAASRGAAVRIARMPVAGLADVLRRAALVVGGDTGPLHLAAAVGAPVVGLYGPTNPLRNGPWRADDQAISQFRQCDCRYQRACVRRIPCIQAIGVDEVRHAVRERLLLASKPA